MNPRFSIALILAAAVVVAVLILGRPPAPVPLSPAPPSDPSKGRISPELASQLLALESREKEVAETTWAVESLAASCGAVLESFWDRLNASTSKWEVIAAFDVGHLIHPVWAPAQSQPHGIRSFFPQTNTAALPPDRWIQMLTSLQQEGWSLLQSEFRHTRFETNAAGHPAHSRFAFSAHLVRQSPPERATLEGPLDITWAPPSDDSPTPRIERLDASRVQWRIRPGPPAFDLLLSSSIPLGRYSLSADPLIARDLDDDGTPEFLLVAANCLYRKAPDGVFRSEAISPGIDTMVSAAVLGEFNGDGHVDLVFQTLHRLDLLPGMPNGRFSSQSRPVWPPNPEANSVMALTAGDVDADGTLDLFLGQYKEPYVGGSSPTPFHAANDGYPAFLLSNISDGRFIEFPTYSEIAPKRHRRMYGASLADLDADGDLDLLTVSDFAGLDLFQNDGRGRFTDVTEAWVTNPHAFGMAHSLADFNADGRLDLLMIGMSSPTVDRLEHLGLRRPGSHQDQSQRVSMAHGNRLYLGQPQGGFAESSLGDSIARSGWSWGCASADFDNDGFPDVAIGNGLESRETVRDYESEYWLHDQHVGTAEEDPAAYLYFKSKIARTRGRGMSYGGYEKNRLYLNQAGREFLEVGHLFGVALEQDSRNVLAEDVDADGRVDLIVVSFEKWPHPKPTLRIFRNTLTDVGHWIGFRIPDAPPGTRVTILSAAGSQTRQVVAGDSYRSQHSATVHFGLGASAGNIQASIVGPAGRWTGRFERKPDRYYRVRLSSEGALTCTE